jgi:prepilin-type N-terminal cleavage/methylation domain-containing protein
VNPHRAAASAGFTLLELMVVVLIMGTVLLLVPINMDNIGARGKLNSTANSLVAALNGARERAILDSYEVSVELGTYRDDEGDWQHGWRFMFTSVPPPELADDETDAGAIQEQRSERAREREWLYTPWHKAGDGVKIVGVSDRKDQWKKLSDGGKHFPIRYYSDGNVEKGVAIRIESLNLDVAREYRTATIIVNPLTSEPTWQEGEHDLNEALAADTFGN